MKARMYSRPTPTWVPVVATIGPLGSATGLLASPEKNAGFIDADTSMPSAPEGSHCTRLHSFRAIQVSKKPRLDLPGTSGLPQGKSVTPSIYNLPSRRHTAKLTRTVLVACLGIHFLQVCLAPGSQLRSLRCRACRGCALFIGLDGRHWYARVI